MHALITMKPNSDQETNAIGATTPVLPVTQTQWVTGMETGLVKNALHVEITAITQETAWQREEENAGVADAGKIHTEMPHAPFSVAQVHQDSKTNTPYTLHHVHTTTTLYLPWNQITQTDHHQHLPMVGTSLTSHRCLSHT